MTTPAADPSSDHVADLVLEGGGVKGIALTGAVCAFDDEGWTAQTMRRRTLSGACFMN